MPKNIYLAVRTYAQGEAEIISFAIIKLTPTDFAKFKNYFEVINKHFNPAYKLCFHNLTFNFIDGEQAVRENKGLFDEVNDRIKNNYGMTILSKEEYERISQLSKLKLWTNETHMHSNTEIRGFAYTDSPTPIIFYTKSFNPFDLTN